jgi:hypothetical protein
MQCRERFMNTLHPALTRSVWRPEEDALLLSVVAKEGTRKWSQIASKYFNGRTDNMIRRRYHSIAPKVDTTTNQAFKPKRSYRKGGGVSKRI